MKTIALCFFMITSALTLFGQAPLSGYDVFAVVTDGSEASTAFNFESYLTRESVRGVRAKTPVVTSRDVAKFGFETREIGGAPCGGMTAVFLPSAKAKLLPLLSVNKAAEVLIAIGGSPRATFKVAELIRLIEKGTALFVIYQIHSAQEFEAVKVLIKQIKTGQWQENTSQIKPQTSSPF